MVDIFEKCPTYEKERITLRQTQQEDAVELLDCYSDERAVPLFNSDNCHGDLFHYQSLERMQQAIDFWSFSYANKYFVRWTIIWNETKERIGTVEMVHRRAEDEYDHYGVLRIDLKSRYETQPVIKEILEIADENFFAAFDVQAILTKAIPSASERILCLLQNGYQPLNRKVVVYDDYFVRHQ